MTTQQKTETLHIRIRPCLKGLAKDMADEEHRTLSNWIEAVILEKAMAKGKDLHISKTGNSDR